MAKRKTKKKPTEFVCEIGLDIGDKRFEPGDVIPDGVLTEYQTKSLQKDFNPPVIKPVDFKG